MTFRWIEGVELLMEVGVGVGVGVKVRVIACR